MAASRLRSGWLLSIALALSACNQADHDRRESDDAAIDLRGAVRASGLIPDPRVVVTLEPGRAKIRNGLLDPPQSVEVTNQSEGPLQASQVMVLMYLSDGAWIPAGCSATAAVEEQALSGCDLEAGARVGLPPRATIRAEDPLPFLLDWPMGRGTRTGTYALVVAFGEVVPDSLGSAARLDVVTSP